MAKTSTNKAPKSKADTKAKPDKQQKKQLKREANLKSKIELVLKELRKAERKATKATAQVDELTAQLQELNGQLTHDHESSKQAEEIQGTDTPEQTSHAETTDADGGSYEDSPAIEELHQASLPPVEGRNDINGNTDTDSSPATNATDTEPAQQSDEQVTSSEPHATDASSDMEEHDEADQQETEHAEEHHPSRRRSSHRRTTTDETHES